MGGHYLRRVHRSPEVDSPPATTWSSPRPPGLNAALWAEARPTEKTLSQLPLPAGSPVHGHNGQLLGWESEAELGSGLGEVWLHCARRFAATGLWPVCDRRWPLRAKRQWGSTTTPDGSPYGLDPYALPTDVYDAANLPDRQYYFEAPEDEPEEFALRCATST